MSKTTTILPPGFDIPDPDPSGDYLIDCIETEVRRYTYRVHASSLLDAFQQVDEGGGEVVDNEHIDTTSQKLPTYRDPKTGFTLTYDPDSDSVVLETAR